MNSTNILKLIVGMIILLYALGGYRRGFIRTLMSMAFLIMAAALVYFANPYVSGFLKEDTPVYDMIEDKCGEIFRLENLYKFRGDEEDGGEVETDNPTRIDQAKIIDKMILPDIIKDQLMENNNSSGYAKLAVSDFEGYIAAFMANLVLRIFSYVVTFLLAVLVLRFLMMTLDIAASLPILKSVNRILGLVLGAAQGICVVWIVFLVITVFGSTDAGSRLLVLIGQDSVLSFLYNTNIFMKLLMGVFAVL